MEPNTKIVRRDEALHITLMDGQVSVLMLDTTGMAQNAADTHGASPLGIAALGRLVTACAMLSLSEKDERNAVTLQLRGDGPIGALVAVGSHAEVKAYVEHPRVSLPLKSDGKLDVGGAVGHTGRLSVIRDMGLREPYIGQTALVSGEIAEDLCSYLLTSQQQPSLVSLGVLVAGETVLASGGLLIQPLPGCSDDIISQLELRSPMFADISREMTYDDNETLMRGWFAGMSPVIQAVTPLVYRCRCDKDRMERALIALGDQELTEMIEDGKGAELSCHFCHAHYAFSTQELEALRGIAREKP